MNKSNGIRVGTILFIFILFYLIVVWRLFYWQVIKAEGLKELGVKQSLEALTTFGKRGDILSSDNYPLATIKRSYLLYANPKLIKDKNDIKKYSEKLSGILKTDTATISSLLNNDLYWIKLNDNLDSSQKLNIDSLNIPGLGFQENDKRFYPEASIAAQLIGFVGKDKDGYDKGYFGLEGYYDEQLSGRGGKMYLIHDALGKPILNDIREEKKIDGRNLILSIDRSVQYITERRLKDGIEEYQSAGGSAIVMEPSSGKILAMASFPQFNPQNYYKYDSELYKNPVISDLYEPGSTFKVLVMSMAIDLGLLKPDSRCNICSGPVTIGDYTIKTWNDKYYPDATMMDVIQHSDNTGMVFTIKKIGVKNFLKYYKSFGLDEETGIDLQGEISGKIRDENNWYPIDLATAGFGQGVSLTSIQLLTSVSAIANGGNLMRPYVVSQIITDDGKKIDIKPEVKRRVISERTAKIMSDMMVNAVEKGEAKWTKINDFKVAGKTGTAQIPIQGHYDPNETIASFIGFFPADKPKISMLILVNRPKKSIYGAETAAPIFFSIARDLINYYNIKPY